MKKILMSVAILAAVGIALVGATGAFYGDVETSTGNTFTAGSIDLRVDSVSSYNGMICTEVDDGIYQWQPAAGQDPVDYPVQGTECNGTWTETDLEDGIQKFYYFTDLKPGDYGEDTISLHVYDNDAWGQFLISDIIDRDNTCTDSEQTAEDGDCSDPDGDGEIDDNITFTGWLDQGSIPGFQCGDPELIDGRCEDPLEGDNIFQEKYESPLFWDNTLIGNIGPFDLSEVFSAAYSIYCNGTSPIGHNDYGICHGLAEDGRMVGSTTYYFGLAWDLDLENTGNEVQTDEYTADLIFRAEQHRNNPDPFPVI